jgi:hypothetical protein
MTLSTIPPLDRTSPTFRSDVDEFFGTRIPLLVSEFNRDVGNFNSATAGGVYAIPYKLSGSAATIDKGGYFTLPSNGSAYIDATDARGADVSNLLASMFSGATSAQKGQIRICKVGDPSKWAVYTVSSYSQNGGGVVGGIAGIAVAGSSGGLTNGDDILMFFQRTGDKGDAGPVNVLPSMYVRYERPSGTVGDGPGSGWTTRALNTVKFNTIPGASLASNMVTLTVAGAYEIEAVAPACGCDGHKARLYDATGNVTIEVGTNGKSDASYGSITQSIVLARVTVTSAKNIRLDHYGQNGIAVPSSGAGVIEVYSEMKITKLS